jgi:prepilin-type N-terminal cleavage/methylation domain-containing protein
MPTSSVGENNAGLLPPAGCRSRGVTLLEMIVVVAIIGLIVGISFPSVSAGIDSVRMVSAADSVAAFLNAAVNRSQRREEPVAVVIDLRTAHLSAYSNDASFSRELTLPEGIGIEAVLTGQQGETTDEPQRRIILMPGGAVPGIGIQLLGKRGARRIVRLDPMTGYPRVEGVRPS